MSDPRPYQPTEWETENKEDADAAVNAADIAEEKAASAAADARLTMKDLVETSREIAATSRAVEKITRDSVISDNKRFRRRNAVLVFLTSALIIGMSYMIYRDIWINSPERAKIAEQTRGLQDANVKLDHIEDFIEEVRAGQDNGQQEELQEVFKAVFETRDMIRCILTAPDETAARGCAA